MRKVLFVILVFILTTLQVWATHYRAGELTYRQLGSLTYEVTLTTYTTDINVLPDSDTVRVHWGDGSSNLFTRQNGNGTSLGNNVKENIYTGPTHTYAGALPFYIISVEDPNRINGIKNVNAGATQGFAFYIEDTLRIYDPTFIGTNNSPVLLNPPIDYANVGEVFFHNPAAYDVDGDSLTFQLINPKGANGVNLPLYVDPDNVSPAPDLFILDAKTGEIEWNVPQIPGVYNIAILVTEFRSGIKLGTVLRDMEIIVLPGVPNKPPVLTNIKDTCVIAGTSLTIPVTASDPNANQLVTLSAVGGPFLLSVSPAQFPTVTGSSPVSSDFFWQTQCEHIRRQSYQVVFKARDNYQGAGPNPQQNLSDLETWVIRIVAPAPRDLLATAQGDDIELTWRAPYACDYVDQFIGFSVWRREGSNPFTPDNCETGLAGRGYTKIAEFIDDFSYVDSNVIRGKNYCYRVLAEFAERTSFGLLYNKVESLPSNEACEGLDLNLPVITNVSVQETDVTNGKMEVVWSKPKAGANGLDTTQFPGPYVYKLWRTDGFFNTGSVYTEIASFTSNTFSAHNDTAYIDSLLNTVAQAYSYKVEFYANGNDLLGETEQASSVYLNIQPTDSRLNLSWSELVPWTNTDYVVYRQDNISGTFIALDTTELQTYSDNDVVNDSLYCYRVMSIGSYSLPGLVDPIVNLSQEACEAPFDDKAPCPPVLTVDNSCDDLLEGEFCVLDIESSQNFLQWNLPNGDCTNDAVKYYIYYAPLEGEPLTLIDSTLLRDDTLYNHSNNGSLAGCYGVSAIDQNGNESTLSNIVCVDNCPCYKLPNVFTPNGDDQNDLYTPILPYLFVEKVDMKIYDRWGTLVYETNDPDILWDGKDINNNRDVKEGVYYYSCVVYEQRINGSRKSEEILTGFIHLIRGRGSFN